MSDDDTTMTRAEALEELARRYRVRVEVVLMHGERSAHMRGSTMATTGSDAIEAGVQLVGLMLERLRQRLEPDELLETRGPTE